MGSDDDTGFDRWLGRQLRQRLDQEQGPRPSPAEARYSVAARRGGTSFMAIRSSIVAALGAKTAAGGAVVALAAGAAAGTAATHSANPVNWGQHVVQVVHGCKAQDQTHIGPCVSTAAQEHGEQVRSQHGDAARDATASPSPKPGNREGQESGSSSSGAGDKSGQGSQNGQGSQGQEGGPSASPGVEGNHGNQNNVHGQPAPTPSSRG